MAEEKKQHVYDEGKIKTLTSLKHIRLRTGMYIGRIGDGSHQDDGCYVLLKEVVDNGIDEYIMGHGKEIQIKIEGTHGRCAITGAASRWARSSSACRRLTPARNSDFLSASSGEETRVRCQWRESFLEPPV